MNNSEKFIGESLLKEKPEKKVGFFIKDKAIKAAHIANEAIHSWHLSKEVLEEVVGPYVAIKLTKTDRELEELRQLVISSSASGVALSQSFGSNDDIGITQRTITDAIDNIWKKLNEMNGEPDNRLSVTVSPDYFIHEDGADVVIKASGNDDVFEKIQVYIGDELAMEREYVRTLGYTAHMTETATIRTVARILGREYVDEHIVKKYFPFFIGSGSKWDDVLKDEDARAYKGTLKGSYDISIEHEGDRMFVLIPSSIKEQVTRMDMNGFEIPFSVTNQDVYTIYTSKNTYQKGIYNIDIN